MTSKLPITSSTPPTQLKNRTAKEARLALQRIERNLAVLGKIGEHHKDELSEEIFEKHRNAVAAIEELHQCAAAEAATIGVRSGGDPK